jgi:hypothetical protein
MGGKARLFDLRIGRLQVVLERLNPLSTSNYQQDRQRPSTLGNDPEILEWT